MPNALVKSGSSNKALTDGRGFVSVLLQPGLPRQGDSEVEHELRDCRGWLRGLLATSPLQEVKIMVAVLP